MFYLNAETDQSVDPNSICNLTVHYKPLPKELYPYLVSTGTISIISTLVILISYCCTPPLRKHPLTIVFRISLFQLCATVALSLQHWVTFMYLTHTNQHGDYDLYYINPDGTVNFLWVFLNVLDLVGSLSELSSELFHALLSIHLILVIFRPFSDPSIIISKFYKPLYVLPITYGAVRLTFWRYYWYGSVVKCTDLNWAFYLHASQFPYEAAFLITAVFIIAFVAVFVSVCRIRALPPLLYRCKSTLIRQNLFYLLAYMVCWTGPWVYKQTTIWKSSTFLTDHTEQFRIWNEFSELIVGLVTSFFWFSIPSIRGVVLAQCRRTKSDTVLPLLAASRGHSFNSLDVLLRKNFLLAVLNGVRYTLHQTLPQQGSNSKSWKKSEKSEYYANSRYRKYVISPEETNKDFVPGSLEITALYPKSFAQIRLLSGLSPQEFYDSLEPTIFLAKAMKNSKFSEGRSGAFFVYSADDKFIIKTISKTEFETLADLTVHYRKHLRDNPKSLLMRIWGGYKVKVYHTTIYIIMMENVLRGLNISYSYDLKGSWVDRTAGSNSKIKKDGDLLGTIDIGQKDADLICNQLRLDSDILCDHQIVDYSLLIGVVDRSLQENADPNLINIADSDLESLSGPSYCNNKEDTYSPLNTFPRFKNSLDRRFIYVFGVIDFLQSYDVWKKTEHWLKTTVMCLDSQGISIVDPMLYKKRFCSFMNKKIL